MKIRIQHLTQDGIDKVTQQILSTSGFLYHGDSQHKSHIHQEWQASIVAELQKRLFPADICDIDLIAEYATSDTGNSELGYITCLAKGTLPPIDHYADAENLRINGNNIFYVVQLGYSPGGRELMLYLLRHVGHYHGNSKTVFVMAVPAHTTPHFTQLGFRKIEIEGGLKDTRYVPMMLRSRVIQLDIGLTAWL